MIEVIEVIEANFQVIETKFDVSEAKLRWWLDSDAILYYSAT